ncbi:aspartyl protease family protein [Pyrinomonas methylaliphatogenes]|uniref:Cytochrome c biogenesis factor n=1 Tax=Pyrinomonas methylaliphatogenes TaxID=454194 RepID=A0A0B6X3I4_9BACT|nr:aspartyl protease family protein [Pyrinomonas methylaliphatogenes]CDM67059.1 cytochrome c biogenesis factor [Pyrinomonas methylaliphatogenes]
MLSMRPTAKNGNGSMAIAIGALLCLLVSSVAADDRYKRAERAITEGDFAAAEKIYRELVERDGSNATARLGLSLALLKQRKLQEAFEQALHVVRNDPSSARAWALVGWALLGAGDFARSGEALHNAYSLNENDPLAVAGLAMLDFYENRLQSSLRGLRRAVFLAPRDPDFIFSLAQAAARSERYNEAADAYERFLRVAPRTDEDRRARIRGLIDFLRFLGAQRPLYQVSGPVTTTVPFELANNRPIIEVRVNDRTDPFRFVLDTGSGMCVISDQTAARLGIRPIARGGMARAVGGPGRFEIVYGFLNSIQIGEARIENVPTYIRRFYNDQEKIDGYIGLSVMSKYLTIVDYATREIHFKRDDQRDDEKTIEATPLRAEIPIRTTSSGFWSGQVKLEGVDKPLNFIIDTGASISVVSEELAEREEMERYAQKTRMIVYGAAGVAENVPLLLLPSIYLGAHARPNVSAVVLDMSAINETAGFEQTGIIGGNVLRHFRVYFDFRRPAVLLEPLEAKPISEAKRNAPSQER